MQPLTTLKRAGENETQQRVRLEAEELTETASPPKLALNTNNV